MIRTTEKTNPEKREDGYYLKVKFKEKIDGRKIWYFNNCYLCDCINATFDDKENCEEWMKEILENSKKPYSIYYHIESVTMHKKYYGRRKENV